MAMTLRLSEEQDRMLERLAAELGVSKNLAAAQAIVLAAPWPDHIEVVAAAMPRLREHYGDLIVRLAEL